MRIYRVALKNKKLRAYLRDLSRIYRIPDVGFVEDLFCFVRASGAVPDLNEAFIESLRKEAEVQAAGLKLSSVGIKLMASKRRSLFRRIMQSPIGLAAMKLKDPLEAVRRILTINESISEKLAASTCRACKLLNYCNLGKKYGKRVRNILTVFNLAESQDDIHPDCPHRAKFSESQERMREVLDLLAQMSALPKLGAGKAVSFNPDTGNPEKGSGPQIPASSTEEPNSLSDEDIQAILSDNDLAVQEGQINAYIDEDVPQLSSPNFSAGDPSCCYRTSHSSGASMSMLESEIDKLSKSDIDLFFLAKVISESLAQLESRELKDTASVTNHSRQREIRQISEVTKAPPSVQALPDDMLDAKIARKDLQVTRHRDREKKRFLRYIVLDTSLSMDSVMCQIFGTFFSRSAVASAFVLALIERAEVNGDILYLRPFEACPGSLYIAEDTDGYEVLRRFISGCAYNGAGTDIFSALQVAHNDITSADARSPLSGAQITLMTDGICHRIADKKNAALMKQWFENIPLNTLDFGVVLRRSQLASSLAKFGVDDSYADALKQNKAPLIDCSDNYFEFSSGADSVEKAVKTTANRKKKNAKPAK